MSAPGYARAVTDGRNDFGTPDHIVQFYAKIYGEFEVDAAANEENHKAPIWYGPGGFFEDAIEGAWLNKRHWLNPPYGRDIGLWIVKTIAQTGGAAHCALLVPNSTETDWWFQAANMATHVRLIKNRIPFIDPRTGLPMDGNPAGSTLFWFGPAMVRELGSQKFWLDTIPEPAEFTELRKKANALRAANRRTLAREAAQALVF